MSGLSLVRPRGPSIITRHCVVHKKNSIKTRIKACMKNFKSTLFCALLCFVATGFLHLSHAELGELPAQSSWLAHPGDFVKVTTSAQDTYQVRSFLDASGVTVKEYFQGTSPIFAVSWQGPLKPNVAALLGRYAYRYTTGQNNRQGLNTPNHSQSNEVVIQEVGHMRAFSGFAYLPAALPSQFDLNVLSR